MFDEIRVYFNSYEEMVQKRVFSYIVDYCDRHFTSNSKLYLADEICFLSYIICPSEEDERDCTKLQTIIQEGTYLGMVKPKDTLGVIKILKYNLSDTSKKCEISYIRDEKSTQLLFAK